MKLLLELQAVATVRSCAYMCVSVAGIRGHQDREGKEQIRVDELRKTHLTFRALSVFLDQFLQEYSMKRITLFEKSPSGRGGGALRVCFFFAGGPLVQLLKFESSTMRCRRDVHHEGAKSLLPSLHFFF